MQQDKDNLTPPNTSEKVSADLEKKDSETAPLQAAVDFEAAFQAAEKKAAEYYDALLRAKAETENTRRRAVEDVTKASKFAIDKFANALLPVKDSLEAALSADNQTAEKIREGVELTLKQLISVFEAFQLKEEDPTGQKFDPNKHQAISTIEADQPANTVVTVLQKGYLLNERVLRPAMVTVAKTKEET